MVRQFRGSISLLLAAIIWGTAFVAQSEGMNYVEPFTYNAIRTLIGGLILIPAVIRSVWKERKPPFTIPGPDYRESVKGGICCGVLLFAASSLQQFGITMTTAGKAGFVSALYVVIVPLLSLFMHRKIPKLIWGCIGAAIAGFYLLCVSTGFSINKGDKLMLICALFFALHIIAVDHFSKRFADGTMMACVQFFTAGFMMLGCMLKYEHPVLTNILAAKDTILYAGIMSCGVAYSLQMMGQRETSPTVATMLMSLEAVIAAVAGCLILHEQLTMREVIGCVLVFAAVVAAQMLKTEPEQNKKAEYVPKYSWEFVKPAVSATLRTPLTQSRSEDLHPSGAPH